MKVTVISILVLVLIPLVSALDFTLDSPQSADLNESFSVNIAATTSDIYDVKIFVQDNSTKSTISEIYDGAWRNPFKYILSIFPAKSEFLVRIISYSSNAELCVRLRKTGTTSPIYTKCSSIKIEGSSSSQPNQTEEKEGNSQENESATETLTNKSSTINEDFIPAENQIPSQNQTEPISEDKNQERIVLTPKKEEIFVSNQDKIRLYAVYAFTFFALIIIILLSLRKL
jgi:hypothetical protein